MSNLVRLSSILFKTTNYHFPGAKDKVDLIGLLFSISLDDEFADGTFILNFVWRTNFSAPALTATTPKQ